MLRCGTDLLVFAMVVMPLAILATEYFRARHNQRHLWLSLAYALLAVNEILFLIYQRDFYFFHVFIDGVVVSLGIIALVAEQKEKLVYPTTFMFHQAFLYMALFAIVALAIVTPAKADTLAVAVLVLVTVFCALVLIQSRYRRQTLFYAMLALWLTAHLGFLVFPEPATRALTALLFSLLAGRIGWATFLANRRMFSENILLFKSRDMVLSMLNDISSSPEYISSVDRTLQRVLQTVLESLSVEAAALYRLEATSEGPLYKYYLSAGTFYPLTPEDDFILSKPQLIRDHLEKSQFRPGESVVGIVGESHEPITLDRKTDYTRMMSLGLNTRVVRNLLAIPFRIKGADFGVLVIQNSRAGEPFGNDDRRLLEALADQAAISVNNTQMYSELTKTVRLRQETNIAMRIQKQLLPTAVPAAENLRIAPFIAPAKEVGGDYYDFIKHDDGSLGIAIGDVSGKGVPAGMIMAIAKTIVQIVARGRQDVKDIVASFSREIYPYMQRGQFMTLNYLRWIGSTRTLHFAGAGHEHILWFHGKTGQTDKIRAGGLAAGLMEDPSALLKQTQLQTEKGDVVVLYTDGVTEARNDAKEMFSLRRLQASLESYAYLGDPENIREQIMRDVFDFMGGAEQYDDITLLVLCVG